MSMVKSCVEVWSRLFDHKPFLQAELNSFVNEFEDKREDREIVNLLNVLNIECEIKNQFESISNFDDTILKLLNEKVDNCIKQTDSLLKCDKAETEKSTLENRRKFRASSWEAYKEEMELKYSQFDNELEKELRQIRKFFNSQTTARENN